MPIARAFTIRREKETATPNPHLGHAASQRKGRPVKRSQISAPVALLSSTNVLSYDAPNIAASRSLHARTFTVTSIKTQSTSDDGEPPSLSFDGIDGIDASSIDDSPTTPGPEPNHLSCYFKPAVHTKTSHLSSALSLCSPDDAPSIPQRVPSHSKEAHEIVHRKRSVQRLMSPSGPLPPRNSHEFFGNWPLSADAPSDSPFGSELAQLDAVAEEMSQVMRDAEAREDVYDMQMHDLECLGADDYMSEIYSLVCDYLREELTWI